MIKIGCSDFPIKAQSYHLRLGVVELTKLLDKTPRSSTIIKWRLSAPASFEFIVCAKKALFEKSQIVKFSHTPKFTRQKKIKDGSGIDALKTSLNLMHSLKSNILYFQLPRSWAPHPDRISELRESIRLFPKNILLVWEPPKTWRVPIIEKVSQTFNMIPAINPLEKKLKGTYPIQYFKMGDKTKTRGNYSYHDAELINLKSHCTGPMSYVVFNNGPTSFKDALRFQRIAD